MSSAFQRWFVACVLTCAGCGDGPGPMVPLTFDAAIGGNGAGVGGTAGSAGDAVGGGGGEGGAAPDQEVDDAGMIAASSDAAVAMPIEVPAPEPSGCLTDVTKGQRAVTCDGISRSRSSPSPCSTSTRSACT